MIIKMRSSDWARSGQKNPETALSAEKKQPVDSVSCQEGALFLDRDEYEPSLGRFNIKLWFLENLHYEQIALTSIQTRLLFCHLNQSAPN